jgi:hypothetical protein
VRSASFFLQLRLFELQRERFHVELGNHVARRQKLPFDDWQVLNLAPPPERPDQQFDAR